MMNIEPDASHTPDVLRDILGSIETLRNIRQHDVPSKLLLGRNATTEEWVPIELQHIRISVCSHMYPCIMALRPLDDAARHVFASLSSAQESPFNAVSRR